MPGAGLTPRETARRIKPAVIHVGAAFGQDASFAETGRRLGLSRWEFYFGARGGALGSVDADAIAAACGFFAPGLVRSAWESALAVAPPDQLVREDVALCISWARRYLASLAGIERLADLAGRVVDAADASGRVLFAAWRAVPDPADDPAARAGLALLRLREHRGAGYLLATVAEGLTPLAAILAGPGAAKATANGWHPPYPARADDDAHRLRAAEQRADMLAGMAYECLDGDERAELVTLLESAHRQVVT